MNTARTCAALTVATVLLGTAGTALATVATPAARAATSRAAAHVHLKITTKTVNHMTTVTVHATGEVPQEYDAMTGKPLAAKYTEPMGTQVHWGDHSVPDGSDAGDVSCKAHAPLVKLPKFTTTYTHRYKRAGSYRIHYSFGVCPDSTYPKGTVKRTLSVQVNAH
jgi:hypothetical protein